LLALAEIIEHPERYHIRLPFIPHEPYFEEVNIGTQIDLNHAARLAGISFRDLIRLNPGYNHWTTSPNTPSKLLIPKKNVLQFNHNLSKLPPKIQTSLVQHRVLNGETLSFIANKYHTNTYLLIKMNHLHTSSLQVGQVLYLPGSESQKIAKLIPRTFHPTVIQKKPIAPNRYKILHIVQRHEDLNLIAHQYEISKSQVMSWNQLKNQHVYPGQHLFIWRKTRGIIYYTVRPGDTLDHIAKYNHLPIETLKRLNPKISARYLHPGQKIKVV
jgi:membrane-bound lytic murein transglycosylase D